MERIEGKKVIITTQPEQQAARFMDPLAKAGAAIYNLPMIRIAYPWPDENHRQILNTLYSFNLLVFTSRNGVSGFFRMLKILKGNYRLPECIKIAAIGESSASEVKKNDHPVHFTHRGTTSVRFAEFLKDEVVRAEDKILLSQGNLAPDDLQDALKERAPTERIIVYNTLMPEYFNEEIMHMVKKQDADLMVFTSPSAFRNFIRITGFYSGVNHIPIACIGNTTGDYIASEGFQVDLVAEHPSLESFAREIISYFNKTN